MRDSVGSVRHPCVIIKRERSCFELYLLYPKTTQKDGF